MFGMSKEQIKKALEDSETALAAAMNLLYQLRRAALVDHYDPVEFDRAVMSYREAEANVLKWRQTWAALEGPPPELANKPQNTIEVQWTERELKHLQFFRWLYPKNQLGEFTEDNTQYA